MATVPGRLPDVVVIGGMKCGTTAMHHYLDTHPDIRMAPEKELNFFFGEEPGGTGNRWRGLQWYTARLTAEEPVVGESSPGYTSPDHPWVAARMAAAVPDVRLIYLVRDPLQRALSQYAHHVRDGAERRPVAQALLDPDSQYVPRSRFHGRLVPFLEVFPPEQLLVLRQEDLWAHRAAVLRRTFSFVGVDPDHRSPGHAVAHNRRHRPPPPVPADVAARFAALVADDQAALRRLLAGEGPPVCRLHDAVPATSTA